jgi:hypothetical protein
MAMSRSRRVVVSCAVSLALIVAGSGGAAASVGAAKTVPLNTWATSVCRDLARWESQLAKLGSTGQPSDPAAGKTAITAFLGGALKATDKLSKDLRSAGVPSVSGGNAVAAAYADAVKGLRSAFATANTDAVALPTNDPAAFALSARALAKELQTAGTTLHTKFATAAKQNPASGLDKAFQSSKACAAVS